MWVGVRAASPDPPARFRRSASAQLNALKKGSLPDKLTNNNIDREAMATGGARNGPKSKPSTWHRDLVAALTKQLAIAKAEAAKNGVDVSGIDRWSHDASRNDSVEYAHPDQPSGSRGGRHKRPVDNNERPWRTGMAKTVKPQPHNVGGVDRSNPSLSASVTHSMMGGSHHEPGVLDAGAAAPMTFASSVLSGSVAAQQPPRPQQRQVEPQRLSVSFLDLPTDRVVGPAPCIRTDAPPPTRLHAPSGGAPHNGPSYPFISSGLGVHAALGQSRTSTAAVTPLVATPIDAAHSASTATLMPQQLYDFALSTGAAPATAVANSNAHSAAVAVGSMDAMPPTGPRPSQRFVDAYQLGLAAPVAGSTDVTTLDYRRDGSLVDGTTLDNFGQKQCVAGRHQDGAASGFIAPPPLPEAAGATSFGLKTARASSFNRSARFPPARDSAADAVYGASPGPQTYFPNPPPFGTGTTVAAAERSTGPRPSLTPAQAQLHAYYMYEQRRHHQPDRRYQVKADATQDRAGHVAGGVVARAARFAPERPGELWLGDAFADTASARVARLGAAGGTGPGPGSYHPQWALFRPRRAIPL
jgi:hypothetical protein